MEKIKKAWIYCAIDAPEDTHGALKEQFKRLWDYGEQMHMETVGSSSDCGGKPLMERIGYRNFIKAVQTGKANTLLAVNRCSLSHSSMQLAQMQAMAESLNVELWSPQEGRIF